MPKQYLPLLGRTVIEWALESFLRTETCAGICVVLAEHDRRWETLGIASHNRVRTAIGGSERVDSVKAGLRALAAEARADDWVLVHDAARPCLSTVDLQKLIASLSDDKVGGILATPVADTLKRSDGEQRIAATVPRVNLWRALTPQMFRYGVLVHALDSVAANSVHVTDEAAAIESMRLQPRLVEGSAENIKITMPGDLLTAERILKTRLGV